MKLPYVVAEILVHAAEAEAGNLGVPMAVAIVDSEGGLQMFTRMDGALPVSTELAVSKAYTAASLRMPTDEVGKLAQPGQALYGIQHTHQGRIVLFGGGLPLCLDGEVVGAIGVSGGTVEQDVQVALPAVKNAARDRKLGAKDRRVLFSVARWAGVADPRANPRGSTASVCAKQPGAIPETPSTFSPALSYWRWHETFLTAGWLGCIGYCVREAALRRAVAREEKRLQLPRA